MTNSSKNTNNEGIGNDLFEPVKKNWATDYFNQNINSKLLVLKLDDLNASIINEIKESKYAMIVLNDNFKIVEKNTLNQVQHTQLIVNEFKQTVAVENVIHFEAFGNYTYIHLKNKTKPLLTSKTLKYYVDLLNKAHFIRPHRKYLVNQKFVLNINKSNALSLKDEHLYQLQEED